MGMEAGEEEIMNGHKNLNDDKYFYKCEKCGSTNIIVCCSGTGHCIKSVICKQCGLEQYCEFMEKRIL